MKIRRYTTIFISLMISLMICLISLTSCEKEKKVPPNILWIIAEDLSQDLGCYGNKYVNTPNIDKLATEGMKFENVFAAAPICAPSRTAMATGMHQTSLGAYHMRYTKELMPDLPEGVKTIYQILKENGYVTANITDEPGGTGKNDWSFNSNIEDSFDFQHWEELKESLKPFMAQFNCGKTHRPFTKANEIEFPNIDIPPYYPDHKVSRTDWANYYKTIEALDIQIGNVMNAIKELGLDKNTIIIFISDHGRPMTRGKSWNYDSGIKIPCIIKIPDNIKVGNYKGQSVDKRLISTIDLSATLLELAGIKKPEWMQGKVFLGKNTAPEREFIYSAVDRTGEIFFKSRCIRTKDFKLIRNYHYNFSINQASTAYRRASDPIYHLIDIFNCKNLLNDTQKFLVNKLPYEELYDMKDDPFEINNLIDNPGYQEIADELREMMDDYLTEIDDKSIYVEDSEALKEAFIQYGIDAKKTQEKRYNALRKSVLETINNE